MVVHPGADEADLGVGVGVARRERGEQVEDLGLREPVREVERAVEPQVVGDVGEQVVDRVDPDLGEHRRAVGVGGGGVSTHRTEASDPLGAGALLRGAGRASVGGQQLAIGGGVHQLLDLPGVRQPRLDQPTGAVGVLVDLLRRLRELLVDGGDLARKRGEASETAFTDSTSAYG